MRATLSCRVDRLQVIVMRTIKATMDRAMPMPIFTAVLLLG